MQSGMTAAQEAVEAARKFKEELARKAEEARQARVLENQKAAEELRKEAERLDGVAGFTSPVVRETDIERMKTVTKTEALAPPVHEDADPTIDKYPVLGWNDLREILDIPPPKPPTIWERIVAFFKRSK